MFRWCRRMKSILTLSLASIVLLSCADSKENKVANAALNNTNGADNTQITTRRVAQHYRVSSGENGTVDCFPDITKKEGVYTLSDGLHVVLASGDKVILSVDDTHWLYIYKDESKTVPCYIETRYLNPLPSN